MNIFNQYFWNVNAGKRDVIDAEGELDQEYIPFEEVEAPQGYYEGANTERLYGTGSTRFLLDYNEKEVNVFFKYIGVSDERRDEIMELYPRLSDKRKLVAYLCAMDENQEALRTLGKNETIKRIEDFRKDELFTLDGEEIYNQACDEFSKIATAGREGK